MYIYIFIEIGMEIFSDSKDFNFYQNAFLFWKIYLVTNLFSKDILQRRYASL